MTTSKHKEKEVIVDIDVYTRHAYSKTASSGRGWQAGWTCCPLCQGGQKQYAIGRGISMHFHQVHTPWAPGKAELVRRNKIKRRCKGLVHKTSANFDDLLQQHLGDVWDRDGVVKPVTWEPTASEREAWNIKTLKLMEQVENDASNSSSNTNKNKRETTSTEDEQNAKRRKMCSFDRNGQPTISYKQSLPLFLKAAAEGNLKQLKTLVKERLDDNTALQKLLDTKDRNGSTAEHWAAGGGHLDCLQFLLSFQKTIPRKAPIKRQRRRDGKTCLHYAARNGHISVIDYLLKHEGANMDVDIPSGDGTTPLHLACYTGQFETVHYLVEKHNANILRVNDFGCGVGHWVAISTGNFEISVNILQYCARHTSYEIVFGSIQKHGHSPVHKAAQKLNKPLIEWFMTEAKLRWTPQQSYLAGGLDAGNHKPSDIWCLMDGEESFAELMRSECGW